jgi:hypothetical protein
MLSSIHPAVTGIAKVRRTVQVIYTDDVLGLLSCGQGVPSSELALDPTGEKERAGINASKAAGKDCNSR